MRLLWVRKKENVGKSKEIEQRLRTVINLYDKINAAYNQAGHKFEITGEQCLQLLNFILTGKKQN